MPAVKPEYLPDDKEWSKRIDDAADNERLEREKDIANRRAWYEGRHPDPLRPLPDKQINDNIKYNLCGKAIDKLNAFIGIPESVELPGGVKLEHGPDGKPTQVITPDQETVNAYYARLSEDLKEIKLDGLLAGHIFIKLFINDEGLSDFALIDPALVTVFWETGKGSRARPLWYRSQWADGDVHYRQDIVPIAIVDPQYDERGRIVLDFARGWLVFDYEQKARSTRWTRLYAEPDVWEFPFAPMLDWRSEKRPHQYYGKATLDNSSIGLNHGVNFLASNTQRILYIHAHPKTVAIGIEPEQIKTTAIDGLWTLPEGAEVHNLEMQSDLASSMAMLAEEKAQFYAQMGVLDTTSIKDKVGGITNFAVRMLFDDQVEQTEELRKVFGDAAATVVWHLATIDGNVYEKPAAKWADPLPVNRLEQVQTAAIEKTNGFASTVTLMEDLGRDPVLEAERKETEQQDDAELMQTMLDKAGERGATEQGNGNGKRPFGR
jgi:hypothetical protein